MIAPKLLDLGIIDEHENDRIGPLGVLDKGAVAGGRQDPKPSLGYCPVDPKRVLEQDLVVIARHHQHGSLHGVK